MAHGDPSYRRLDHTGINLAGPSRHSPGWSDGIGLDMPSGCHRLRANNLDSAPPNHAGIAKEIRPENGSLTMSPQAALQSEVFRAYALIMAGVLAAAGVVLSALRWGLKRNVASIWATYRSWLVMAPLALGSIFAGRVPVILFFCVVAGFGFKEFARATGLYRDWWMTGVVYLGIAAVGVTSLVRQPQGDEPGNGWYGLFIALPVYVVALILLIPIARNRVTGQLQGVSLSIVGFIYFGWMFGHLAFLANATNAYGYLLYLLFATEINDVAAFACGKVFGKHPL